MQHIILIVGASGVGKDSLIKGVSPMLESINFVPRFIDRKPDCNENNFYLDRQSFYLLKDFFVSVWEANSHIYGIAKHFIKDGINIISTSRSAIKDFESQFDNVSVIEVFIPFDVLKERLVRRNRESKEEIEQRLLNAKKEIIAKKLYRFENSKDLKDSIQDFMQLIKVICNNFHLLHSNKHKTIMDSRLYNFFAPKNNPSHILHFLGSSDSGGIPIHNCNCIACESYRKSNKKNLATSAYLQTDSNNFILIDCGTEDISNLFDGKHIKAIFLTHFHADHCLGLLKLRYSKNKIICFHPKDKNGFGDLFKHKKSITYKALEEFEKICIDNISFTAIPLLHSKPTMGYFIETEYENIAYLTDCYKIDSKSLDFLKAQKIDICYIDSGAYNDNGKKDSNNHLDYKEASNIIDAIKPKEARLFHISHKILAKTQEQNLKYPYLL